MKKENIPNWIMSLEVEDLEFIKKFLINSGSLKKLASDYKVSYPTVRLRLNRLIELIEMTENQKKEISFITYVKKLAIEEEISLQIAQDLINKYEAEGAKNL